jgi:asparagine synthase (glutamine-hydrolysing)
MCGIAGYVGTRGLPRERIDRCLELMHRRGPDAAGAASVELPDGREAHLLATRLDIIDLNERANQPLRVGSKTLVFNGELYNYLEVRSDLERAGRRFATTSDTEVFLTALDEWGIDGLDRCEGMWAFAVHDAADGSVLVGRDRFGEKPLFVHADDSGITFASEPKGVFALLGRQLPVNVEQLRRFLGHGYRALHRNEQSSFFVGLRELPAATCLRIDADGRCDEQRYWKPLVGENDALEYEEAVELTRTALIEAVGLRLRADVPLAFCMSGGVDSNSLIAIAKRVFGYDVHGFTIENADVRYDEREAVAEAVNVLGIRHTRVPVTTDSFLPRLRELVSYHDGPIATISYYAHWLLMEEIAAAGYRVAVSGTGADELFTGYYDHHLAYLHDVRSDIAVHAAAVGAWQRHVQPIVRNEYLRDPDLFVREPKFRAHLYEEGGGANGVLAFGFDEPFSERNYAPTLLRNRMLNELFREVVPVILHEDDLNAMYYSIENRSPYLDRRLYEATARIPTRHLVRDGYAKAVLRDAVRRIAPDTIVDSRRKVGFNAPVFSFLDRRDPVVRDDLLSDSPAFELVRREAVVGLLDAETMSNTQSKLLFSFTVCKLFLEEFA